MTQRSGPGGAGTGYTADLARCHLLIECSGAATAVDDRLRRHPAGRKRETRSAGVLTLLALSLLLNDTGRMSKLRQLIEKILSRQALQALGLVRRSGDVVTTDQLRYWFLAVHRAYGSDPLRFPKLSDAQRHDNHDAYDALLNQIVAGWLPAELPMGDLLGFDGMGQATSARPLPRELRKALLAEHSPDLLLNRERKLPAEVRRRLQYERRHHAVEARWGHATPTLAQPSSNVGGVKFHSAISASLDPNADIPLLTQDIRQTPAAGYSAGSILLLQLAHLSKRLGTDWTVVADREYSLRKKVWQTLREQNWEFLFDLRPEQRRPRGTSRGARLLQGNALCPATPVSLRVPKTRPVKYKDGQLNPKYTEWMAKLEEQTRYRAHLKSTRPHGINVACPALGPSPSIQCPLRGALDPDSALPIVQHPPAAATAPDICRNKTVFIPDEANELRQTLPWGRADWNEKYGRARSLIESVHGQLKHADGFRLSKGVTASSFPETLGLLVALDFALRNLKEVRAWLDRNPDSPAAHALRDDLLFASDETLAAWWEETATRSSGRRPARPRRVRKVDSSDG